MAISLGSTAAADFKLGDTQVDKICLGDTVVWQKSAPAAIKALKFSSSGAQTLGLNTSMLGSITPSFEYSLDDGATWTAWTVSNPISFGNGTDLYLRGTNTKLATTGNNYTQFVFSTASPVDCSGNIMHLFDHTQDLTAFPATAGGDESDRGLKELFKDCAALVSAPELPATTLSEYCYYFMFSGCTALTTAPNLPATTLADDCYEYMFSGCTALIVVPNLPAITLANACYRSMFSGCTALTTVPTLPATALRRSCYRSMFEGCIALNTLPDLSNVAGSTSDADHGCGRMFANCTAIKMSLTQEDIYTNSFVFAFADAYVAPGMFANTGGTFTGTPTQQTLYTSNTIIS